MHSLEDFRIGDLVVIEGWSSWWDGCPGVVVKIDAHYVYLDGDDPRFLPYKFAPRQAGFSAHNLSFTDRYAEYKYAVEVLGEGYFA